METDRRGFMKLMFAGTALLACSAPPWAFAEKSLRKARRCSLLLGGSGADDAFENGVRAAYSDTVNRGLHVVKLEKGLLADPNKVAGLLEKSREMRWIVVMDDASATVFQELVRSAGGRLISRGDHAYSENGLSPLRHVLLTASPEQGLGGILASSLIGSQGSFSITESFLREAAADSSSAGWSAPGFSSYRLTDPNAIHLHCSGLSLSDGCGLLGMTASDGWTPLRLRDDECETVTRQSGDWVESLGYAVAASAFGASTVQESCSKRAFVHRTGRPKRVLATQRLSTFVVDI